MRISVITVTGNCATSLPATLASVAAQRGVEVEHIVIDGGSSDGTLALAQAAPGMAKLVSEADRGPYDALNKGYALATGEIVGILNGDDVFAHEQVLAQIAATLADGRADLAYGDLQYISRDGSGRVLRHWSAGRFEPEKLRRGWMPPHPTVYLRRSLLQEVGPYDLRYKIASDYDWLMRLLQRPRLRVAYLGQVLVRMRVGGLSNGSLRNLLRKSYEDLSIMRRQRLGGLRTLVRKNLSKLGQLRPLFRPNAGDPAARAGSGEGAVGTAGKHPIIYDPSVP